MGFQVTGVRKFRLAALVGISSFLTMAAITDLIPGLGEPDTPGLSHAQLMILGVDVLAISPVIETCLFAAVFTVISRLVRKPVLRIILFVCGSDAAFAALHLLGPSGKSLITRSPAQAILIGMICGSAFSIVYARTARRDAPLSGFWPTAFCHGTYNACMYATALFISYR